MSILVDQGFAARRKQLERDRAVAGDRTNSSGCRDRRYVSRIGRKQRLVGKTSECRPGFVPKL